MQVFADLCPALGLRVGMAAAQTSVGTEAATLFPEASRDQQSLHGDALMCWRISAAQNG